MNVQSALDNPYTNWIRAFETIRRKESISLLEIGWGKGTNYLIAHFKKVISVEVSRYTFPYKQIPNHIYSEITFNQDTLDKDDILINSLGKSRPDFTREVEQILAEVNKYDVDFVFVDFGFHFRSEVVQALINQNKHLYIAFHDTNFPYYGYESLLLNNYDVQINHSTGKGTVILKRIES